MSKTKTKPVFDLRSALNKVDTAILRSCVNLCDGHTIFAPAAFTDLGFPQDLIDRFTTVHTSDTSNPKATIFTPTGVADSLKGVYGLSFLYGVAGALGVQYEGKLGRGSQAHAIQFALGKYFSEQDNLAGVEGNVANQDV